MDVWTLNQYSQAKSAIEAREIRQNLMIADWPHYKDSSRKKIDGELQKQANPFPQNGSKRLLTHEEIKASLGAMFNG